MKMNNSFHIFNTPPNSSAIQVYEYADSPKLAVQHVSCVQSDDNNTSQAASRIGTDLACMSIPGLLWQAFVPYMTWLDVRTPRIPYRFAVLFALTALLNCRRMAKKTIPGNTCVSKLCTVSCEFQLVLTLSFAGTLMI